VVRRPNPSRPTSRSRSRHRRRHRRRERGANAPIEPAPFDRWSDRFRLDESWFRPTGRFAFALVRSDTFALGVYEGDERVAFEGFTSDVKEAHSKGGFSQGRFERRREGQIDEHLKKATAALADLDANAPIDRTIVVGERSVLGEVREHADITDVSDATGKPRNALDDDAFHDFWMTRIRAIWGGRPASVLNAPTRLVSWQFVSTNSLTALNPPRTLRHA